ncbi:glycosyltransferase [Aeromicrobium sp. YIM 150415]|uniref:glycosyltransferase n=1 Tax=Aeromicrobium sp. YIM 150415 TaxID=2803912 RepID=UPI0019643C3A|nr:glycosyltransferase [Aeromicrobium sp. YIM 150415]MBM9465602.1 glycosyltransferase [Aeromicrobium sp. YIM 150415]
MGERAAERIRVSVCLATYNGAAYLDEQLDSILAQLGDADEVVVVDDGSTDGTLELLAQRDDPRIEVRRTERNLGYVGAFGQAMGSARGEYLVLSDQDDVWPPGRVEALVAGLADAEVAVGNVVDLDGRQPLPSPVRRRPWLLRSRTSRQHGRNLLRIWVGVIPYFGSAMALRREALDRVLPLPSYLSESHDLWIATVANVDGSIRHLDDVVVWRRLHETNASTSRPRSIVPVLRARLMLLRLALEARRRR